MTQADCTSLPNFHDSMIEILQRIATNYELSLESSHQNAARSLDQLIELLSAQHGKVVVLIDEYDKPILDNLNITHLAQTLRDTLRQFYAILKAQDHNLRFVILTGVTKFSRVSIFSGLNNLQDISMSDQYATLCGYTEAELIQVFDPWIKRLATMHQRDPSTELSQIKRWYNGYQFSRQGARVYNPFSTLLLFEQQEYRPHWFVTGTPTFLINLIEESQFAPENMETLEVDDSDLESHDVLSMGLIALLYQTGYLTIESYDAELRLYKLNYPNFEVRESFTKMLLERISETTPPNQARFISEVSRSIRSGDYSQMFQSLQTFLAVIPYQLHQPTEKYYHSMFYLVFHLIGYRMSAEVSTNRGRMDAVLELKDRILIFEFKLNQSADIALQQIKDKQYAQRYQNQDKPIECFGVNFDTTLRNIVEWKQLTLNPTGAKS
jgi:hypothetical protein